MNRTSGFCLYKYVFLCDFPVKIIYLNMYVTNTFLTFNANCFIFKDIVSPSISVVQEHIFSISYNKICILKCLINYFDTSYLFGSSGNSQRLLHRVYVSMWQIKDLKPREIDLQIVVLSVLNIG